MHMHMCMWGTHAYTTVSSFEYVDLRGFSFFLLCLYLLGLYLGELLDRVGLRVDGHDGHDKEDGEADDLVRVRVRVRIRVRARARARARVRVRSRLDGEADDRGEVAHDGVEVAEHLDGGQLAHPHECLHLEEDLEAARAPGRGWGWGVGSG